MELVGIPAGISFDNNGSEVFPVKKGAGPYWTVSLVEDGMISICSLLPLSTLPYLGIWERMTILR